MRGVAQESAYETLTDYEGRGPAGQRGGGLVQRSTCSGP